MTTIAPPLAHDPRRPRRAAWLRVAIFGLAVVGAGLLGHLITLPEATLCTFQILFERPCPGCGMTRSIQSLAQGDVVASLRFHPLGFVLLGGSILGFFGGVSYLVRGRDPAWEFLERRGTWVAVGLLVGMVALWIVRGFVVPEWSPDAVGETREIELTYPAQPSGG